MALPLRILLVTVGLIVAGGVFGATAGGVAFGIATLITEGPAAAVDPSVFLVGGVFGGPIGAVAGPAVAWLLLRHVPLGKLFLGAVVGTVIGGVAGWLLSPTGDPFDQVESALLCAFTGFLVAAILMRVRTPRLRTGPCG